MSDPLNDPRWPDRPQHPDFWRMAEVIMRLDGASTEGGKTAEEIIGVDLESFRYMAQSRIDRTRQLAGAAHAPLEMLLMTLYMDAFALGKGFCEASKDFKQDEEGELR